MAQTEQPEVTRRWYKPLRLFFLMVVNYGLIAIGIRMLALGSYVGVAVSDGLFAFWNFSTVKKIVAAETGWERAGYVTGGMVGSLIGLWLTK